MLPSVTWVSEETSDDVDPSPGHLAILTSGDSQNQQPRICGVEHLNDARHKIIIKALYSFMGVTKFETKHDLRKLTCETLSRGDDKYFGTFRIILRKRIFGSVK